MASVKLLFTVPMVLMGLLMMDLLDSTDAQIGVCYGMEGNNLPTEGVITLYKNNYIQRIRLYYPDVPTLTLLGGSNIQVMLGIPNTDLQSLAADQIAANTWVRTNIIGHPDVNFRYIVVGNEISPLNPGMSSNVPFVLPVLRNIQVAINLAGLGEKIKVTTTIDTGLTTNTYPPSDGVFRSETLGYITPIIQFLVINQAPLLVNLYPYFAQANDPKVDLDFALFKSNGIIMPGGVRYQNLFDAMLDATYAALEKAGGAPLQIVVSETGWPTAGGKETTIENARTYNTKLIEHVKSMSGSPRRPGRPIETYIFAMFDEDLKKSEVDKHWGLFFPNQQPKYPINFR